MLAEDLRNGGVLGVAQGIREAARAIGWKVRIVDAGGTAAAERLPTPWRRNLTAS